MKKNFILSCLCVFLSGYAIAQGSSKIALDLGVKVGANFNQIDGSYWENGYKANLMAGAYIALNGPKLGVQIEPLFTQSTFVTGNGFNDLYKDFYQTGRDTVMHGKFRVNYYNVPIMLNVKIFSKVWLQLGPQFSGTLSVKDNDKLLKDSETFFKKSMISAVDGLWITLPANLTVSGRYVLGFNNINNNADYVEQTSAVKDQWKQKMLQVGIGYTFS